MEKSSARSAYMRDAGFVFATAVGERFFEDLRTLDIRRITNPHLLTIPPEVDPATAGMALLSRELAAEVRTAREDEAFEATYDVASADTDPAFNRFLFQAGLGDLDFTFHFAPAIASSALGAFEEAGHITAQQRAHMSLGDWADTLRAPWFSTIMHDLALTSNGIYGQFGTRGEDYRDHAFSELLGRDLQVHIPQPFTVTIERDQASRATLLSAAVSKETRRALRQQMHKAGSPGCPVARYAGSLPLDRVLTNHHARWLIDNDRMTIDRLNLHTNQAHYRQDRTAIDVALGALAEQFDRYDTKYGTPQLRRLLHMVEHVPRQRTDILTIPYRFSRRQFLQRLVMPHGMD